MIAFQNTPDINLLKSQPTVPLGVWPTPLQTINHETLGRVLIKRDDLAGYGGDTRSGVKARKIEGLLAHMQASGLSKLSMPLGNITNLGIDLVKTAKSVGIDVDLLITNSPELPLKVREQLFQTIADSVTLHGTSHIAATGRLLLGAAKSVIVKDGTLMIAPSPAHPAAMAGTARGYFEAMEQCIAQTGALPRSVYIASASGSTVAGLIVGEALMRQAGAPPVIIVPVTVSEEPLHLWLGWFVKWTLKHFDIKLQTTPPITICRIAQNAQYARFTQQHIDICDAVDSQHDFKIDPIYGAKAWLAMEQLEVASGQERPVLFWHCGYTPNWKLFGEPTEIGPTTP